MQLRTVFLYLTNDLEDYVEIVCVVRDSLVVSLTQATRGVYLHMHTFDYGYKWAPASLWLFLN